VTASITNLQVSNKVIRDDTATILDLASDGQKKELLDKICSVDYLQQHRDTMSRHHFGTGYWFLNEASYQDWAHSPRGTLVCPGVPGAGKTVMAALVIENHRRGTPSAQQPVVFIYYSYKRQAQQNLRHILETMVRQLVDTLPGIPASIKKLYDNTPSTDEVKRSLLELLTHPNGLTVVTDALDECHDHTRPVVLNLIAELQAITEVRYLATTRDFYAGVSHAIFRDQPMLEIRAARHDLEVYTRARAQTLRAKLQPDVIEDLVLGVVVAADGM
jgi:hypothetical protein